MSISVHCEACGASLKVKDGLEGKKVRCRCGAAVLIPDQVEIIDDPPARPRAGRSAGNSSAARRPTRKSSADKPRKAGNAVFLGISIACAVVAVLGLGVYLVASGFITRGKVSTLHQQVMTIHGRADLSYQAASLTFAQNLQSGGLLVEDVRDKFLHMHTARETTKAELDTLTDVAATRNGPQLVEAVKEWLDARTAAALEEGPAILRALRDRSRPLEERGAEARAPIERYFVKEAQANLRLLEARRDFYDANGVSPPDELKSQLAATQAQVDQWKVAPPALLISQSAAQAAIGDEDLPEPDESETNPFSKANDDEKYPVGTVPLTSISQLKPGMIVWTGVKDLWWRQEVVGLAPGGWVKVKAVEGGLKDVQVTEPLSSLRIDPSQLTRSDLASVPPLGSDGSSGGAPLPRRRRAGPPVLSSDQVQRGMKFLKKYGRHYYEVEVLDALAEGQVRIHWVGWLPAFDEECPVHTLRGLPDG